MMALRPLALAALALLAACGKGKTPDPARPDSYAAHWAVEPAPGGSDKQRLVVPATALLAMKTGNLGDLRLFDATGRALPFACLKETEERREVVAVPSYPVRGSAAPREAGVAIAIGPDKVARVVGLAGDSGGDRQVALLVDSRAVDRPAMAVELAVNLPLGQPVTFTVAASRDLKTWETIGEKTLFRTDPAGNQLEPAQVPLGGIVPKDRYLQVTWDRAEGVALTGAQMVLGLADARPLLLLATRGARLQGAHEVHLALPLHHSPDALVLNLAGNEGVLPVQLYSRPSAEAAWQPLIRTTLRGDPGQVNRLPLDGATGTEFRIEADRRTAGFAAVPQIRLEFGEVVMLGRFNGQPPYRLAAGLADAPRSLLNPADIVPTGDAANLPEARVRADTAPVLDIAPARQDGPFSGRKAVLWLVLLFGVTVLVYAVRRLLQQNEQPGA